MHFFAPTKKNIFVCAKRVRLALLCVPRKELLLIRRHTNTHQPASVACVTATVAAATASAAAALRAFVVYAMCWVGGGASCFLLCNSRLLDSNKNTDSASLCCDDDLDDGDDLDGGDGG